MDGEGQNCTYEKVVKVCGMDEAQVRDTVSDLTEPRPGAGLTFDSRPGEVDISVSAQAETEKEAKTCVKDVIREMKMRLGGSIFTTDADVTLEQTIVDLLKEQKMTITTVESCTGGMLSARLTDVAGVSEVFKQGFVTYSNKAKKKLVGVKKMTLKRYSAVSEQTAKEMARGGLEETGSDVCVSVTGYAGPDGGEDGQPAGLVYIGCNVKGKVTVEEYHFKGDRRSVREQATAGALVLLRRCILENYRI